MAQEIAATAVSQAKNPRRSALAFFLATVFVPLVPGSLAISYLAQGEPGHYVYVGIAIGTGLVLFVGQVVHALHLVRRQGSGVNALNWSHVLLLLAGPLGALVVALEASRGIDIELHEAPRGEIPHRGRNADAE